MSRDERFVAIRRSRALIAELAELLAEAERIPEPARPMLDQALRSVTVLEWGEWWNQTGPPDWYAVDVNGEIVAYFGNEEDAYRFRLAEVNRMVNG